MTKNAQALKLVSVASVLLASMTREELNSVAKVLNVPVGKSRDNTERNLTKAITEGRANLKAVCFISKPITKGENFTTPVFIKKLRTYKGDRVLQAPDPLS